MGQKQNARMVNGKLLIMKVILLYHTALLDHYADNTVENTLIEQSLNIENCSQNIPYSRA